jgi:hypothetical protein
MTDGAPGEPTISLYSNILIRAALLFLITLAG